MGKSGRTGNFIKNAAGAALLQIVNMACGMITPRFMLVAYGSQLNGLVSSITQFLSTLAIVEAGLGAVAQQSLYKPLHDQDEARVSAIVSAARIAYHQVGYIFSALAITLSFLYPVFAKVEELSYFTVVALVLVLAMHSVISFFVVSKYRVLFQADQKVYVLSLAQIIMRVFNTICIIVLATRRIHILVLRLVVTGSVVIQAVILWRYARKHYAYIDYKAPPEKSAFKQRWDALYTAILGSAQSSAPGIILTLVVALESVSVYSVYNMVFGALMGILGVFTSGVNASFGSLLQSKDRDKAPRVYAEFENAYYVFIAIIYTVAMVMIAPFVKLYTTGITDTDYLLPGLGFLFAVNGLMYNLKTPQGMMVQAAGLFKKTRWQNTTQAAILIIGGFILGDLFGIYGVIIASILSNLYRVIDLLFFIPKNVLHCLPYGSIRRVLIMLTCSILLYIVAEQIIPIFPIESYFDWVILAVPVTLIVSACILTVDFICERKNFLRLANRMLIILGRKKR